MAPDLSVVVPLHNEAPNIDALCGELTSVLAACGRSYEVVLIDDGSTDGSFERLRVIQSRDPHFRLIRFRRNFGQTAAFAAGFAHARGAIIVTADGDLQNDPRDIPSMMKRIEADECDVVCGWRKDRKDPLISRRLPAVLAGRLISWATGVRLHDYGCSLKAYRAEIVRSLRLYGEMHRFLPALANDVGARIVEQAVNHRPRLHGTSKYGISRTFRVVLDLMTVKFLGRYAARPLHVFGTAGLASTAVGLACEGWVIATRVLGFTETIARPLFWVGLLLILSGVQLVAAGLVAEMLARTYFESQGKPTYWIREIVQAD
jgi:glycosyltransferase involved in cell wall biosynthesis